MPTLSRNAGGREFTSASELNAYITSLNASGGIDGVRWAALEIARAGEHNIIPHTFSGSDPDLLWTYYHSGQPFNWSKVADPELDELLDKGRSTLDPAARAEIYRQVQQKIMELALLVPIRDPVNLNGAGAHVRDLHFDAHDWFPLLHDVSIGE